MADQVMVQVVFTIPDQTGGPPFTDALYYTPEAYAALTPDQLAADEQARFVAWQAVVNQPPPPPPTPDELAASTVAAINDMMAQGTVLIAALPPETALPIAQGVADASAATVVQITDQIGD